MAEFNIIAELNKPMEGPEDEIDEIMEDLLAYHPALGRSPFGRIQATITVLAESVSQATALASAIYRGHDLIAVQVMSTDDFDRLHGLLPLPDMLSVTEAAELLEVSRTRVQQLIDSHRLPATRIGNAWAIPAIAVPSSFGSQESID